MKIKFHIYAITSSNGEESYDVASEQASTITVGGYKKGKYHQFECEAYHFEKWCKEMKFNYKIVEKEIEI